MTQDTEFDFHQFVAIVRKRWMLIVIVVAVCVLITGAVSVNQKPLYRATAVVCLPTIMLPPSDEYKLPFQQYDVEKSIDSFDLLRRTGDLQTLSKSLDISPDQAAAIQVIRTKPVRENKSQIEVTLEVRDQSLAMSVTERLVHALNNQKVYRDKIAGETAILLREKEDLQNYLQNNERLYQLAEREIRREGITSLHFNPADVGEIIMQYRKKLADIDTDIKSMGSFSVMHAPVPVPVNLSTPKRLLLAAVLGCITGLFAAVFMEWLERT